SRVPPNWMDASFAWVRCRRGCGSKWTRPPKVDWRGRRDASFRMRAVACRLAPTLRFDDAHPGSSDPAVAAAAGHRPAVRGGRARGAVAVDPRRLDRGLRAVFRRLHLD